VAVDAAGGIDFGDGQFGPFFGKLAVGGKRAGHDVNKSHLDRLGRPGRRCQDQADQKHR
jgi:hypothetical protein